MNIDSTPSSESSDEEFKTEEYGDILDEDIYAFLDSELSSSMSFSMVEVPTPMPTTGTEEGGEKGGEMISNELKTVNDDPVASNQLWIISIVFGAGLLLVALYAFQTKRRIASINELNADEVSVSDHLLLSCIVHYIPLTSYPLHSTFPTRLMVSLSRNMNYQPTSKLRMRLPKKL